eukprot:CAMPEP_0170493102 /NCGR_PEP_ID=MMETSP0208-20121228/13359_1 /TAXON_ID=197538 /ORGANISM="Strombidium inclinatum, Strain S3" /LENGTH=139 /DNA_ID=CAMNT_0010768977 /DNA_START=7 /DNA_END=426 /DNA_ORIENTATION=+
MSNSFSSVPVRPTSDKKMEFYVKDSSYSMSFIPVDMMPNSFFGKGSQVTQLPTNLNWEMHQKYYSDYQSHFKAELEVGSAPFCFNECVQNVEDGLLSSDEKNCVRECYFKRVSSRDDASMMFAQKLAMETSQNLKHSFV